MQSIDQAFCSIPSDNICGIISGLLIIYLLTVSAYLHSGPILSGLNSVKEDSDNKLPVYFLGRAIRLEMPKLCSKVRHVYL